MSPMCWRDGLREQGIGTYFRDPDQHALKLLNRTRRRLADTGSCGHLRDGSMRGSGAPSSTQVSSRAISMGGSFFFGGMALSESR